MTPAEFRRKRLAIGYSSRQAGIMLGVDSRTVRRWEAGTDPVPGPVGVAMEYHLLLLSHGLVQAVPPLRRGRPAAA